jgi:hypothetical protein
MVLAPSLRPFRLRRQCLRLLPRRRPTHRSTGRCRRGYARLVRIVSLLDRISVRTADPERLENGARAHPGLHCGFDYEQPARCDSKLTWRVQPAVRQVDMSEASIAVPPRFRGAFNVAQDRWRHRLPVGCSQQCEDPRFLAAQALQPTWPSASRSTVPAPSTSPSEAKVITG